MSKEELFYRNSFGGKEVIGRIYVGNERRDLVKVKFHYYIVLLKSTLLWWYSICRKLFDTVIQERDEKDSFVFIFVYFNI